MGENIGVTPLLITQKDVFPTVYPSDKVSLYGKVTLRKAGCAVADQDDQREYHRQRTARETGLRQPGDCYWRRPSQRPSLSAQRSSSV